MKCAAFHRRRTAQWAEPALSPCCSSNYSSRRRPNNFAITQPVSSRADRPPPPRLPRQNSLESPGKGNMYEASRNTKNETDVSHRMGVLCMSSGLRLARLYAGLSISSAPRKAWVVLFLCRLRRTGRGTVRTRDARYPQFATNATGNTRKQRMALFLPRYYREPPPPLIR